SAEQSSAARCAACWEGTTNSTCRPVCALRAHAKNARWDSVMSYSATDCPFRTAFSVSCQRGKSFRESNRGFFILFRIIPIHGKINAVLGKRKRGLRRRVQRGSDRLFVQRIFIAR